MVGVKKLNDVERKCWCPVSQRYIITHLKRISHVLLKEEDKNVLIYVVWLSDSVGVPTLLLP